MLMLEWALDDQKRNLVDGMLPFNGDEIYEKMMKLRDNTGAWVEYYEKGLPLGCKCRPWESRVNIEAAIKYWEKKERNN